MSELLPENYNDLITYHGALKQFLSMSSGSSKLNSARAAKARDKLLKLSASQFFELSTDVYDELQRRIDESSDEPDFLLPKSSFHPKRNEAREKLGSLQQTRFRDLVSDILYEIERRGFHKKENFVSQTAPLQTQSRTLAPNNQHHQKTTSVTTAASGPTLKIPSPENSLHIPQEQSKQAVVSLQSTTVIPKEANMAWSSDEEDDEEEKKDKFEPDARDADQRRSESSHHKSLSNSFNTSYSSSNSNNQRSSKGTENRFSETSETSVSDGNKAAPKVSRGFSLNKSRSTNKDRDIELLIEEGTKMDKKITLLEQNISQLEQKNSLLSTRSDKFQSQSEELSKINESLNAKVTSLESALALKNQETQKLNNEISTLKSNEKKNIANRELQNANVNVNTLKSNISNASTSIDQGQVTALTNEIEILKRKLAQSKSTEVKDLLKADSSFSEVGNLNFDKNGLVPSDLFKSFSESIQKFLLRLNDNYQTKAKVDTNEIFGSISKISNSATKISNYSPHSEKSELIRASISHAITSTRYYAIYGDLLPKLVIESSISEVVFAVFDFISYFKINDDVDYKTDSETTLKNTDVSPVRPLRMAKKIDESNTSSDEIKVNNASEVIHKKPLNLSINPILANATEKPSVTILDSNSKEKSLNISKNTNRSFNSPISVKTGVFPSVVSRFSPDTTKEKQTVATPTGMTPTGMRKSSSGNILSRVKQFEQQELETSVGSKTPSPSSKKSSVISPLSETIVGKFGKRNLNLNGSQGDESQSPVKSSEISSNKTNDATRTKDLNLNDSIANKNLAPPVAIVKDFEVSKDEDPKRPSGIDLKTTAQKSVPIASNQPSTIKVFKDTDNTDVPTDKEIEIKQNNVFGLEKIEPDADILKSLESEEEEPIKSLVKETTRLNNESSQEYANFSPNLLKKEIKSQSNSFEKEKLSPIAQTYGQPHVENSDNSSTSPFNNDTESSISQNTLEKAYNLTVSPVQFKKEVASPIQVSFNSPRIRGEFQPSTPHVNDEDDYNFSPGQLKKDIQSSVAENKDATLRTLKPNVESTNNHVVSSTSPLKKEVIEPFETKEAKEEFVDKAHANLTVNNLKPGEKTEELVFRKHSIKKIEVPNGSTKSVPQVPKVPIVNGFNKPKPISKEPESESDREIIDDHQHSEEEEESEEDSEDESEEDSEDEKRTHMDLGDNDNFDIRDFDIENPDNTLSDLLYYLEHQTVDVITTIQTLLIAIKAADSTKGELRRSSKAIADVVGQMVEATSNSMNQSRNVELKEHGSWLVDLLNNAGRRIRVLCADNGDKHDDEDYADKQFKQRLAGVAFDLIKFTKDLVKSVEEASLKEEIEHLKQ